MGTVGLSCRISCRACPRPTWRVPRPQQPLWRCLAPSATIGSSRSTRTARCTGGSATCHGGAVQRSTNSRVRGARAALEASSSPPSTAAPRRSEESARFDLQTTTHRRRCALAPRRRLYLELARHEVPARDTQFRAPAGTALMVQDCFGRAAAGLAPLASMVFATQRSSLRS